MAEYRGGANSVCDWRDGPSTYSEYSRRGSAKVHHLFVEPYAYIRKDALVVGGGNSAAEAALFLSEEGARTTLAIWREDWENRDPKAGAMKHWVRGPLEKEVAAGRLRVILYRRNACENHRGRM